MIYLSNININIIGKDIFHRLFPVINEPANNPVKKQAIRYNILSNTFIIPVNESHPFLNICHLRLAHAFGLCFHEPNNYGNGWL